MVSQKTLDIQKPVPRTYRIVRHGAALNKDSQDELTHRKIKQRRKRNAKGAFGSKGVA